MNDLQTESCYFLYQSMDGCSKGIRVIGTDHSPSIVISSVK